MTYLYRLPLLFTTSIAVLGCVEPEVESDPGFVAQSGDRLQIQKFVADGGATTSTGFFDLGLDIECRFQPAEDGQMRCLPYGEPVMYRDPECTEPVVDLSGSGQNCESRFAIEPRAASTCGELSTTRVYRVGAAVAGENPVFSFASDGACRQRYASTTLHALAPMAPTEFMAGSVESEERPGGLTFERLVGDDGSAIAHGLVDRARASACWPTTVEGQARCVPANLADSKDLLDMPLYAEADCSTPAARTRLTQVCEPDAIVHEGRYYELGERLDSVWASEAASCNPAPVGAGYALGTPIAETSLPELDKRSIGSGRIVAEVYVDLEGRPVSDIRRFFDNELSQYCAPVRDANGAWRCMPESGMVFTPGFADQSCVQPLAIIHGDEAPPVVARIDYGCDGARIERVFEVGDRYEGEVWLSDGTFCGSSGALDDGETAYEIRGEVDISNLAELNLTSDSEMPQDE